MISFINGQITKKTPIFDRERPKNAYRVKNIKLNTLNITA